MKDIATNRSNGRRFFLAVMLFLFHKFTGTDSLNYFAPEIFEMIGVKAGSLSLLDTGVYGIVKLITTIFYVTYLVDRVGRRRPLIVSIPIHTTDHLGGLAKPHGSSVLFCKRRRCSTLRSMYDLRSQIRREEHQLAVLLALSGSTSTPLDGKSSHQQRRCELCIHACVRSFGWSVAPYVVAAEIFPARIRSFSMSFCFFINWIVDYGITKATPSMMSTLGWGTFLLYAVLTYIGAVFVYFCMPEFKGRSIESMDDLFQRSIWTMWKHAYPTEEEKVRHDVQDKVVQQAQDEEKGAVEELEVAAVHGRST
jgi:hypothetical protein